MIHYHVSPRSLFSVLWLAATTLHLDQGLSFQNTLPATWPQPGNVTLGMALIPYTEPIRENVNTVLHSLQLWHVTSHSVHRFLAPFSKLCQNWLHYWRGTLLLRADVHQRRQRSLKGLGTNINETGSNRVPKHPSLKKRVISWFKLFSFFCCASVNNNRRFLEITGKDNLTVFSYSRSNEWRLQLRRVSLQQF